MRFRVFLASLLTGLVMFAACFLLACNYANAETVLYGMETEAENGAWDGGIQLWYPNATALVTPYVGEYFTAGILVKNTDDATCTVAAHVQADYTGCGSACLYDGVGDSVAIEPNDTAWLYAYDIGTFASTASTSRIRFNYLPAISGGGCTNNDLKVFWTSDVVATWYIYGSPDTDLAARVWVGDVEVDPRVEPDTTIVEPEGKLYAKDEQIRYCGMTDVNVEEYPDEILSAVYFIYEEGDLALTSGGLGEALPCVEDEEEECWGFCETIPMTFVPEREYQAFGLSAFVGFDVGSTATGETFGISSGMPNLEGCELGWGEDFDLVRCVGNLLQWFFVPPEGFMDEALQEVANEFVGSIPISYIYSIYDTFGDLEWPDDELPSFEWDSGGLGDDLPIIDLNETVDLFGEETLDYIRGFEAVLVYLGLLAYVWFRVVKGGFFKL